MKINTKTILIVCVCYVSVCVCLGVCVGVCVGGGRVWACVGVCVCLGVGGCGRGWVGVLVGVYVCMCTCPDVHVSSKTLHSVSP